MALSTVADYIDTARFQLQDTTVPYRYSDADIVGGLNLAIGEMVRVRPDLFFVQLRTSITSYTSAAPTDPVDINLRYQQPVIYFIVGYVQLSDEEDVQDQRAVALITKFTQQLTSAGA
jgi:hypothetical protein